MLSVWVIKDAQVFFKLLLRLRIRQNIRKTMLSRAASNGRRPS